MGVLLWAQAVERHVLLGIVFYEWGIKDGEDVDSIYTLAILLENGAEGVTRSRVRAIKLYERYVGEGDMKKIFFILVVENADGAQEATAHEMKRKISASLKGKLRESAHKFSVILGWKKLCLLSFAG